MKKVAVIWSICFSTVALVNAWGGGYVVNGKLWNSIKSEDSKVSLLLGYKDGLTAGFLITTMKLKVSEDDSLKIINNLRKDMFPTRYTAEDMVRALDRFYSDTKKLKTDLAIALQEITKNIR